MTVGALRTPLVLLVELLWGFAAVALFVQFFGGGDGPAPSLAAIAVVVAGSYAVARALQASSLDETELRIAGLLASIAGLTLAGLVGYATFPPWGSVGLTGNAGGTIGGSAHIVAGMLAMLVLWLRGVNRGQLSGAKLDEVLASSSIGFLIVVVAALSDPPARGAVSWSALAFAYSILVLVTLAALQAPEPEAGSRGFVRRYALGLAVLAAVAFALALGAAATAHQTADAAGVLSDPLRSAGRELDRYVIGPLLASIAYPFALLADLIAWVLPEPKEQPQPVEPPQLDRPEPEDKSRPLWQTILFAAAITSGLLAAAAAVVTLIWFAFRRFVRREGEDTRERRDHVEPATSLSDDLAALFGVFGRRLRGRGRTASAVAIRRLYSEVLATAQSQGLERPASATPLQFAPALDAHFASGVASEITEAFAESRYGERVVVDERVRELTERWRVHRV